MISTLAKMKATSKFWQTHNVCHRNAPAPDMSMTIDCAVFRISRNSISGGDIGAQIVFSDWDGGRLMIVAIIDAAHKILKDISLIDVQHARPRVKDIHLARSGNSNEH